MVSRQRSRVVPERTSDYEVFLAGAVAAGRLRYVKRFDGHDDLYAVVKNEPDSKTEAALPFSPANRDWAGKIQDDPVSLLGQPLVGPQDSTESIWQLLAPCPVIRSS